MQEAATPLLATLFLPPKKAVIPNEAERNEGTLSLVMKSSKMRNLLNE